MKNLKNNLLSGLFLLMTTVLFSQGKIQGTVVDGEQNGTLPGVNVIVKGSSAGASTDIDGKFILNTTVSSGQIVVSFIGYQSVIVNFSVKNGETVDLGTIKLKADFNELEEVVIKSTIVDIAKDRKTPVAVSTIKASEIKEKLGNQEFPEILNNTPSVYATKSGGGFGDSRINIRGFSQENIAVMVNGVPVNDMENSRVFWSNWAGLSDVTSAMQVQRGLGSSKLAISSVGGTINVVTKSSDMKEGGSVSSSVANDDYLKVQTSYSTGLMSNGFSASVLFSSTTGDGYVDGTKFEGKNYFIAFGYKASKKHDFQFTFTGAPQWHHQRSTAISIGTYLQYGEDGEPNRKYNADWGYLNGQEFSMRRNFYHKPVASINWDWNINETTKLSTVVYGSWGRGGGSGGTGAIRGNSYSSAAFRTPDGLVDYDKIHAYNSGQTVSILVNGVPTTVTRTTTGTTGQYQNTSSFSNNTTNGISRISSFNSHDWYGGIINLNKKLSTTLTLDFGIDARTYKGIHYQNLNSLLGGDVFVDKSNLNFPSSGVILTETYSVSPSLNPFASSSVKEKLGYDNDGNVNWYGAFTQLEYSKNNLTAFIQGAISQQGYKRVDRFLYPEFNQGTTTPNPNYNLRETSYENIIGGNVKGGLNYNINKNHNVFANAGYYSKQPFFNAVYPNNKSLLNENLTNEKIVGVEAGYGFRSSKFNANLNFYRTAWKDRFMKITTNINHDLDATTPTISGTAFLEGVEQIHMGGEFDFTYKPVQRIAINGMVSIGNWKYGSDVTANYQDDNNVVITNPNTGDIFKETLYIDGLKVGDAAQTTASIGATFEVLERFKIDGNYRYVDNLYASIDPASFRTQVAHDKGSLELPAYGLVDAGLSYKMLVGSKNKNSVNFRLNVNNLLDDIYIAESRTNTHLKTQGDFTDSVALGTAAQQYTTYQNTQVYDGLDKSNQVFFGFGRTWNFSIRYDF